jgi:adenylate cyclase
MAASGAHGQDRETALPLPAHLPHLALALGLGVGGALVALTDWAHRVEENYGLLALFTLRGAEPPPQGVEIAAVDEASLARLRALPADPAAWPEPLAGCQRRHGGLEVVRELHGVERLPRVLYACLIDALAERGVDTIVFDVAFTDDPTRSAGTDALARAIAGHGRVVLLTRARRLWRPDAAGRDQARDEIAPLHPALAAVAVGRAPFTLPRTGPRVHQIWTRHPALAEPTQLPVRALEARALGILERLAGPLGWPDPPAGASPAARALARLEAFHAADPAGWRARLAEPGERDLLEALRRLRQGPDQVYLDLYGPPGTIPHRPIAALLTGEPGAAAPAAPGTVVFVGPFDTRTTLAADSFPTVFSDPRGIDTAGVELAATAYANLRDGRVLRAPSEAVRALLVLALGALATLLLLHGTLARGLATALALGGAYALAAALAFAQGRLWLPLVVPLLLVLPLALLLGQLARYLGLVRWLGVFTPRPVTADLLRGVAAPGGAAGVHPVTVMFTDIVGSSALTELLEPARFADRLNAHFTLVTRAVQAEGGVVVEFLGDGLMAYWGGPRGPEDHAVRACRAALAIAAALARDNRARAALGEPPIRLRIGINSGAATLGTVGAPERGIFTVTGDTANAAQRIEQLAKQLCPDRPTAAVLVGEATFAAANASLVFEAVGEAELRGRARREQVYRLIGADTVGREADAPVARPG